MLTDWKSVLHHSAKVLQTLKVWDLLSSQAIHTLKGHTGWLTSVAYSPDGTRIATASRDQTIILWDPSIGQESLTLNGHSTWVSSVAFSPDGHLLASASDDGIVKVWNATPRDKDAH